MDQPSTPNISEHSPEDTATLTPKRPLLALLGGALSSSGYAWMVSDLRRIEPAMQKEANTLLQESSSSGAASAFFLTAVVGSLVAASAQIGQLPALVEATSALIKDTVNLTVNAHPLTLAAVSISAGLCGWALSGLRREFAPSAKQVAHEINSIYQALNAGRISVDPNFESEASAALVFSSAGLSTSTRRLIDKLIQTREARGTHQTHPTPLEGTQGQTPIPPEALSSGTSGGPLSRSVSYERIDQIPLDPTDPKNFDALPVPLSKRPAGPK